MHARTTLLAALALAAVLLACEGSPAPDGETPSPAAPTETASPPELPKPIALRQAEPLSIGGDDVLIIETGCTQCDGPTEGLVRVYTKADGTPVVDTLLDPAAFGFGPRRVTTDKAVEQEEPYITGYAVSSDASEIWVSICLAESCGSGGLDAWSAGSRTVLMRSTDGGVSWERAGTVEIGGFVIKLLDAGRPIIGTWDAEGAPLTLRTFPDLDTLEPPQPQAWPIYVRDGEILWRSSEGESLLNGDGDVIVDFGADAFIYSVGPAFAEDGVDLVVAWSLTEGAGYLYFLTLLDATGRPTATYEAPSFMMLSPAGLEKGHAYGNAEFDVSRLPEPPAAFSYLSAVFDLTARSVHPLLDPFAEADFPAGRNQVAGVSHGPFLRVVSPDACLPLRAEPSASAREVACAADGVLLSLAGDAVTAEGIAWQPVRAPDGSNGLVDSAFLSR